MGRVIPDVPKKHRAVILRVKQTLQMKALIYLEISEQFTQKSASQP
jgi:hypothetical protein